MAGDAATRPARWPLALVCVVAALAAGAAVATQLGAGHRVPADPAFAALESYHDAYQRMALRHPSTLHWNKLISLWTSPDAATVYRHNHPLAVRETAGDFLDDDETFSRYPVGSMLVKDNRTPATNAFDADALDTVTAMRREADERAGDPWRYIQVDARGKTILDGRADDPRVWKDCAQCHSGVKGRDFVFHTYLDEPVR